VLPRVIELAREGRSGQTIADRVGVPKRTVNHWLHELRQEWIAETAGSAAEMFAMTQARLTAVYSEAMEEWQDSKGKIEVVVVEEAQAAEESGGALRKRSVRTQPQRRNAALLGQAIAAAKAIFDLTVRGLAAPARRAESGGGATAAETPTEEDSQPGRDDQSRAAAAPCEDGIEPPDSGADSPSAAGGDPPQALAKVKEGQVLPTARTSCPPSVCEGRATCTMKNPCFPRDFAPDSERDTRPAKMMSPPCLVGNERMCDGAGCRQVRAKTPHRRRVWRRSAARGEDH
jgi:transposase